MEHIIGEEEYIKKCLDSLLHKQNTFIIIIPSYNCPKWIGKCLKSVEDQTYKNYKVCVIDDASTEVEHTNIIKKYCENNKWSMIINDINIGALTNIVNGINKMNCDYDDIIVTLDGDDWFAHDKVLEILNLKYQDNTQITYGRFKFYAKGFDSDVIHHNAMGYSEQVSSEVIDKKIFRKRGWVFSHLRTFKYRLWSKIKKDDLCDPKTHEYFRVTWDMAFMFPMLEMAGHNIKFIDYPLYVYNVSNPMNDFKLREKEQIECEKYIRSLPVYPTLYH